MIGPASVDLWWYLALGGLVGAMKAWAKRFRSGAALLALIADALDDTRRIALSGWVDRH